MQIHYIADQPKNIAEDYLDQFTSMITAGGQVEFHLIERGIRNASLLSILATEGKIIAGCCLKSPIATTTIALAFIII